MKKILFNFVCQVVQNNLIGKLQIALITFFNQKSVCALRILGNLTYSKALVTLDVFAHHIAIRNITILSYRFIFINQGKLLNECNQRYVRF